MKSERVEVDEEAAGLRRRREEVRRGVNPEMGRSPLRPRQIETNNTVVRGIAKLGGPLKQVQVQQGRETPQNASWSQIVRTNSTGRLPTTTANNLPSPTTAAAPPSPSPPSPTTGGTIPTPQLPDYHRGPKVDPRW